MLQQLQVKPLDDVWNREIGEFGGMKEEQWLAGIQTEPSWAGKARAQIYDGRIRPARPTHRTGLIPLSVRLHEFGRQAWRSPDSIGRAMALSRERALTEASADAQTHVAEKARREPLGVVSLQTATDSTGEMHAYISDLVVRSTAQGSRCWNRCAPRS
jgi:hypothetical protein